MKRLLLASLACSGMACPIVAMAQPMLVPGRDVTVLYRLGGEASGQIPGGAPDGVRLQWDAAGQRLRAEPVGRPVYAITDLGRRVADFVFAQQGAYMETRIKGGDVQTLLAGRDARFTRRGTERLLGLECTDWAIRSPKIDGTGCVTVDGVVLRASITVDGRPGTLTALSVVYAPQPAEAFAPPAGFSRLALPGFQ